jgi:hypothetical protein
VSAFRGDIPHSHIPQTYGGGNASLLAQVIAGKILHRLAPTPKPKGQ